MRSPGPVLSLDELAAWGDTHRHDGRRVVLTCGAFDLVHRRHIQLLEAARAEGDALIVAVQSDRSERAVDGPSRPFLPEAERAELLTALDVVDAVFVVDDDRLADAVRLLRPDVVAAGDREVTGAPERLQVAAGAAGARLLRLTTDAPDSTPVIIGRVRRLPRRR